MNAFSMSPPQKNQSCVVLDVSVTDVNCPSLVHCTCTTYLEALKKTTYSGSFPCLSIKTWIWNSWFFFHFLDFSLYNRSSAPTTVSLAVTSLKSKKNVLSFSCLRCGTFLALKYKKNQNKDQIF